jgi:ribosomal protein S18 acetylase RimI-like enzyme
MSALQKAARPRRIPDMKFQLTPQMIDKIGFAMEDQEEQYVIDVDTGELVRRRSLEEDYDRDRLVALPRWGSAEGFYLMESFITSLHNPLHSDLLASALSTGKGVFRNFKNTLKKNPEIEKLWFRYKERRLRGVIISWYNVNREARGLQRLAPEPEDTDELVASDFSFSHGVENHLEEMLSLDREAFFELFPSEQIGVIEERFNENRKNTPGPEDPSSLMLVAETPLGSLAGFVWGVAEGRSVHIVQLAVVRELRGIGLGQELMKRFLSDIRSRGMTKLLTELSGKSLRFSDFFQSMGFTPRSQVLECNLDELSF